MLLIQASVRQLSVRVSGVLPPSILLYNLLTKVSEIFPQACVIIAGFFFLSSAYHTHPLTFVTPTGGTNVRGLRKERRPS